MGGERGIGGNSGSLLTRCVVLGWGGDPPELPLCYASGLDGEAAHQ